MKLAYQTLLSYDLKIKGVFEEINNILSQKLAKRAMNLLTKKDHNKCKISYMRKKSIFV